MRATRLLLAVACLCSAVLVSSCSRKVDPFEKSFVEGCASSGSRERCQCTYDEIHKHYGDKRMADINNGQVPSDFGGVLNTAMTVCIAK